MLKAPAPPNVLAKHSATALIHLFNSVRVTLKRGAGTISLKDLTELTEDHEYMHAIGNSVKEVRWRAGVWSGSIQRCPVANTIITPRSSLQLQSSSSGADFHGIESMRLIEMLRNTDGFRAALGAVEAGLRPSQVAMLKSVVARCEDVGSGVVGASTLREERSAPLAVDLVKAFKETFSTFILVESTGVLGCLRERSTELDNGEEPQGYMGRVSYEEVRGCEERKTKRCEYKSAHRPHRSNIHRRSSSPFSPLTQWLHQGGAGRPL